MPSKALLFLSKRWVFTQPFSRNLPSGCLLHLLPFLPTHFLARLQTCPKHPACLGLPAPVSYMGHFLLAFWSETQRLQPRDNLQGGGRHRLMQLTGFSLALPSGNSTSSPGEHVLLPCLVLVRCWWLCTTPGGFVGHTALDFVKCRAMGTTEIQQVIAGGGACSGGEGFCSSWSVLQSRLCGCEEGRKGIAMWNKHNSCCWLCQLGCLTSSLKVNHL